MIIIMKKNIKKKSGGLISKARGIVRKNAQAHMKSPSAAKKTQKKSEICEKLQKVTLGLEPGT